MSQITVTICTLNEEKISKSVWSQLSKKTMKLY